MKRPAILACIVLMALAATLARGADKDWVAISNDNARVLLQVMAKYSPESASQLGVDGYDEAITDYSRDFYAAQVADTRRAIAELRRRLAGETDARTRQDLEILIGSAQDSIISSTLNRKYFFPFINVAGQIFGVVQQTIDPRVPLERQRALLARLEKYAGLAPGTRPTTELAKRRALDRIRADRRLLGPYRGEVEKVIGDNAVLLAGVRDLLAKSELKGWERAYAALEVQLNDYNAWLRTEILPRARADHRLPPEIYADNLRQYGVDVSPEEMIARGLTAFAEVRNQMTIAAGQIAAERGYGDPDYHAVVRKLKEQQIAEDQLIPFYTARLAAIEKAIGAQRIVSLPDRKASIRLATAAENAQIPAPHINPPRFLGNTGEYAEFVLTTGTMAEASGKVLRFDDFSNQAVAWTLTAHEARPGHELQFARMLEAGVSTARAVFAFNSVNVEGWALYAEAEMQPYEPLDGQLMALQHRALRAARAFLDPMVNLGRIAPQTAKAFLMDEVCLSEAMATQEMQRYTFDAPGQATSYLYGYQRLMETRQAAQLALGDRFDRQAFNDFVLSQGLLPPKMLRRAVMESFVAPR